MQFVNVVVFFNLSYIFLKYLFLIQYIFDQILSVLLKLCSKKTGFTLVCPKKSFIVSDLAYAKNGCDRGCIAEYLLYFTEQEIICLVLLMNMFLRQVNIGSFQDFRKMPVWYSLVPFSHYFPDFSRNFSRDETYLGKSSLVLTHLKILSPIQVLQMPAVMLTVLQVK